MTTFRCLSDILITSWLTWYIETLSLGNILQLCRVRSFYITVRTNWMKLFNTSLLYCLWSVFIAIAVSLMYHFIVCVILSLYLLTYCVAPLHACAFGLISRDWRHVWFHSTVHCVVLCWFGTSECWVKCERCVLIYVCVYFVVRKQHIPFDFLYIFITRQHSKADVWYWYRNSTRLLRFGIVLKWLKLS